MRRTAEEADRTRAALIDAALFVFAQNGIDATRLADVADRAGLTRGAVYYHFHDKDALLSRVIAESWESVTAPVWAALGDAPTPDSLRAFLDTWIRHLREDKRFRALLTIIINNPVAPRSDGHPDERYGLGDWQHRLIDALESCRHQIAEPFDPDGVARHLLAWLSGTALLAAITPDLLPADGVTAVLGVLSR